MFEVLQSPEQFREARQALRREGRSALEAAPLRWMRRLGLVPGLAVGELNKSWDVARTLQVIEQRLPRDAAILDLGAFCSELPVALAMMGYTQVHGIDLNPDIAKMPFADKVRYTVGNFMETRYPDASFDAVTAISVIEHGYEPERLLAEVARLLRPGGMFIASFDYWPQKIDTTGTTFFGLSWLIFSQRDYQALLETAARHGLHPLAGTSQDAAQRAIHCAGFDYTFAWTVLQKS